MIIFRTKYSTYIHYVFKKQHHLNVFTKDIGMSSKNKLTNRMMVYDRSVPNLMGKHHFVYIILHILKLHLFKKLF